MSRASRLVVVGAGHLGRRHLDKVAAHPDATLTAVVEPDPGRRAAVEARHGVPAVASVADLLACPTLAADAAILATPTSTHAPLGLALLRAGLHLLVEKPLAQQAAAAAALVAAARAGGRVLQVGHVERFNPAVTVALAAVAQPRFISSERMAPFSGRGTDVDVVLDLMVHDLDLVAACTDAPLVEVRAVGVPVITAAVDMCSARLAFADGLVAQLAAGRASLAPCRTLRLFCADHYLSVDCAARTVKSVRRCPPAPGEPWPTMRGEPLLVPPGDPLDLQLGDFLAAIAGRRQPRVDGAAGLRALRLAESVVEAMAMPAPRRAAG